MQGRATMGDFGRRAGAVIAAVALALAMAGTAQASQISATPTVTGAGSITGTRAPCALQVTVGTQPTNTSFTTCGTTTVTSGSACVLPNPFGGGCLSALYFGVSLTLTAVPVPGWQFDHWDGCVSAAGAACIAIIGANTSGPITIGEAPTAFFKEIVPVSVASGPPAFTNSKSATVTYSGSVPPGTGALTFRCQLDSQAAAACPDGGQTYDNLADGATTIKVWGIHHG